MSCSFLVHRTQRMRAEAFHGVSGSRVEVTVTGQKRRGPDDETVIVVPFDCENAERKAEAYANAINIVDEAFHPRKTMADLLPRVGPMEHA